MITKNQLIISCIFNGTNTIMLFYYIWDIIMRPSDLEHITRWSYYLNSIFTTICLFCDIVLYFQQSDSQNDYKLLTDDNIKNNSIEKLNDWNRNKFSPVCNSISYFVLIGFWTIYFFGNDILFVNANIKSWFNSYYHHLIITIIIIIDLFVSNRKPHNFSWTYMIIIFATYFSYCLIIIIEKYYFHRNAYIFMKGSSLVFLIFCMCITMIFLMISYLIHIYLIKIKLGKFCEKINENSLINHDANNNNDEVPRV